jgi:hypothetical protein
VAVGGGDVGQIYSPLAGSKVHIHGTNGPVLVGAAGGAVVVVVFCPLLMQM